MNLQTEADAAAATRAAHRGPDYEADTGRVGTPLGERHAAVGSPARMAVLLYLASHPEGATRNVLHCMLIEQLDSDTITIGQVVHVLQRLRDDGLLALERDPGATPVWFSPMSRQAAHIRSGWRKPPAPAPMSAAAALCIAGATA